MKKILSRLFKRSKKTKINELTKVPSKHAKDFQAITRSSEKKTPGIKLKMEVTQTSYYTKPKQISHKKVYTDDDLFSIRGNVIRYRDEKKITQKEISNLLGLGSVSFISRLERGDMQSIKHEDVKKLATSLKVNIDKLLLGSERID